MHPYFAHIENHTAARAAAWDARDTPLHDARIRKMWGHYDAALVSLADAIGGKPKSTAHGVPAFLAGVYRHADIPKTSPLWRVYAGDSSPAGEFPALDHRTYIVGKGPRPKLIAIASFPYEPVGVTSADLGEHVVGIKLAASAYGWGTDGWLWVRANDETRIRAMLGGLAASNS